WEVVAHAQRSPRHRRRNRYQDCSTDRPAHRCGPVATLGHRSHRRRRRRDRPNRRGRRLTVPGAILTDTPAPYLRILGPHAPAAQFPPGALGAGTVSVGARGDRRDWEPANRPDKGSRLPFTFFAIRAASSAGSPVTKVLEARLPGPHEGDQGYDAGRLAGL